MMHLATELRSVSENVGLGVFATKPIPRGTFIWVLDPLDRAFSSSDLAEIPDAARELLERYAYRDPQGNSVLCWDHARFMNHSCTPSTLPLGTLGDIAVRDLRPGDELTCDYAMHNSTDAFSCACGSVLCRHWVSAENVEELATRYDELLAECWSEALSAAQPLMAYMRAEQSKRWTELMRCPPPRSEVPSSRESLM